MSFSVFCISGATLGFLAAAAAEAENIKKKHAGHNDCLTLSNSFLYQINLPPLLEAEEEDERPDGAAILTTSATAAAPLAD